MHMVQDWKECWRQALGGTSISLMILFLLGTNFWVLWWERPASLDRRTRPWLGFFLMLVVLAPPLFIYFVSCKFKISSYVEVCVPFKSSSLHQCSRPFWKLRQLLWGFCLLWVVNSVEWMMLWLWPWEELLWRQHSSRFHSHPPYLPDPLGLRSEGATVSSPQAFFYFLWFPQNCFWPFAFVNIRFPPFTSSS